MTLLNRIYNLTHRVKKLNRKGCFNCGIQGNGVVKFDWSIPMFKVISLKYKIKTKKDSKMGR